MKLISGSSLGRRSRRRFTTDQIQDSLRALDRSGLSLAAFARQHGLVYSVLSRWVHRRDRALGTPAGTRRRRGRPPKLREVPLGSLLGAGQWAAELVRPDGLTLRLARDVPATWVGQLLGAC
jgi:hypothetical protein